VARLNDDAQWIILMGFLISFSFFFLAIIINQSTVVGQTTAESVIEFPKNDIRDITDVITYNTDRSNSTVVNSDIKVIALNRKTAVVNYNTPPQIKDNHTVINIHYNNGVTDYYENWTSL
jgi:5,10-methylene-tetrahydrofolate dehydrogenase/methenyl tetrahydrofolate cyclohydrolase